MNQLFERALPTKEAWVIAQNALIELQLSAVDTAYGVDLQTHRCALTDEHAQLRFYGFGKGLGLQSKVSAYFEALEHYALFHFVQKTANNPDAYRYSERFNNALPHVVLNEVQGKETLPYPVFLLDPRYSKRPSPLDKMDYTAFTYLANDSGVASGTNAIEASIHAINELIERDAHSLFLIEAFIKKTNQAIRLIDKKSLPNHLNDMVNTIERQFNEELLLFDITSDVGVPVMYVSMTRQAIPIQPSGCGASLKAEYALERALLETLQPAHINNQHLVNNQLSIINHLQDFPLLLNAALADVTSLKKVATKVSFQSIVSQEAPLNLEQQLRTLFQKIETIGCKVFTIPIMSLPCGFTCVKFLIPDFESFHLIQTGKRVLPNQRGTQLLNRQKRSVTC